MRFVLLAVVVAAQAAAQASAAPESNLRIRPGIGVRACTLVAQSGRRTIFTSTLDANIFDWPRVLADRQRGARVAEVAIAEPR